MGFWVALGMLVVSTVVSALLAPKPKDAEPSSLGEFQVPTAEEGRSVGILLGTGKVKAPNITWWGALRTEAIKRVSNALTGSRTTIGYRYRLGMQQVLSVGPIDELVDIIVGDKSLKDAGAAITTAYSASGADLTVNLPDLFGGDEKEGGLVGALRFYFGSDTQIADSYLAGQFSAPAPAWRGICYAVLKDFYVGTSNYPKEWAWVLRACPCAAGLDATKKNINGDANPAYGIAHILTQPREKGGCGESLGTLDLSTFQAAANTLFTEGFGISLLMDRAQAADMWMGEILRHIDGVLYTDPATGLTCLKLIRADYDPATLPEFFEADMPDAPEVTLAAPPDTLNRVVIRYTDRAQGFTPRTAQEQDAANYWSRSEGADTTVDFLGLSNPTIAQLVAAREIRGMASPLAKGTLQLNRKAWQLRPGSPFKLTFGPHGWSGLICRVTNIRYGTLGAGKITVEFAQDVFAVGSQSYAPPSPGGWVDPVGQAHPCAYQALMESPYWMVGESRCVLALGARADRVSLNAEIWSDEGAGYLLTGRVEPMHPVGLLTTAYPCQTPALDSTGFVIGMGCDLDLLPSHTTNADGRDRGQNLAWFESTGELISWTTCTDNGNGTYTISGVLRGILDSVPQDQPLGGRVWFLPDGFSFTRDQDVIGSVLGGGVGVPLHASTHLPGGGDALPWTTINGRGPTTSKPAPTSANAGFTYFDTTLGKLQRSNGIIWEDCEGIGPGSIGVRSLGTVSTSSLAPGASASLTITLAKTCAVLNVASDYPAEIRLYDTMAARAADASRPSTTPPVAGNGLVLQNTTTPLNLSINQDPVEIFANHDSTTSTTGYLTVINKDTSPRVVTISIIYLPQE